MLPSTESENRAISARRKRWPSFVACVALIVVSTATSSCIGTRHTPEQLTQVGFRTPRQTFETFQAALDYDLLSLEYRCLSADFKKRNDLSDLGYREFREELAKREPFLRLAAHATIVKEWDQGSREHWIEIEVSGWLGVGRRTARLRLVREEFWEIYADGEPWLDHSLDRSRSSRDLPAKFGGANDPRISASVPVDPQDVDDAIARTKKDWSQLSEFRVGYEWKIDDLIDSTPAKS